MKNKLTTKMLALAAAMLLPAMAGWAQDTLSSPLQNNYFYNREPNTYTDYARIGGVMQWGDHCGIAAKEMYNEGKGTLAVYGIAACMMTDKDLLSHVPEDRDSTEWMTWIASQFRDTSVDELYEYLGIYLRSADSLVAQREVLVHRKYDTPAYYVETGLFAYHNPNFVYPMYEKYFDSAILIVSDTFYVGTTQLSMDGSFGMHDHMDFMLMGIQGGSEYHVGKYCYPQDGRMYWNWPVRPSTDEYKYYLIFPILTPAPDTTTVTDTTGTGGDTTAVTQADMVGRYVAVQPNPTSDEARVLSSFGLERIEAFNTEGQRVADLPASGLEATLDVRRWPAGTYLLRVTTPAGTVTKRLLVR